MTKIQCPTCRGCTRIVSLDNQFKSDKICPTCKGTGVVETTEDNNLNNKPNDNN
jgi:DnaJ-class molecular chaperone